MTIARTMANFIASRPSASRTRGDRAFYRIPMKIPQKMWMEEEQREEEDWQPPANQKQVGAGTVSSGVEA